MRIAVSGSHCTGKSTLIDVLSSELKNYQVMPEPYFEIIDEGHSFAYPPSLDDFELQLERSIQTITSNSATDIIFDRSPVDYLAYLAFFGSAGKDSIATSFRGSEVALRTLSLVIFVPIERPDRIDLDEAEGRRLRKHTDEQLRRILVEDTWGLGIEVLEVRGSVNERARQILDYIHTCGPNQ
jgi:predicted ATPase